MKRLLLIAVCVLVSTSLFATEYDAPMQLYKPNYFIAGGPKDQVKFQISAKYNLIYPSDLGFWIGYTQRSFWALYDKSSPFRETNYEPEFFWRAEVGKLLPYLGLIDYIQLSPIFHRSNGRDGLESRGMNTYYGEIQLSVGDVICTGVVLKAFGYYNISRRNPDLPDYLGYCEGEAFIQLKSATVPLLQKERLYIRGGGNYKTDKGWLEGGFRVRIITSVFQPYLYVQVFHGYGESMIDYNKKDTAVRVGIMIE